MVKATCRKCGNDLPAQAGPGRPADYCSKGCRRAAEYELRRLQGRIEKAEDRLQHWRQASDGAGHYGGSAQHAKKERDWWAGEVTRLETRLRDLLDAAGPRAQDPETAH